MAANAIAEILLAQVDDEWHCSVLLQEIVDHHVNGREVMKENAFIISHNDGQLRKETTQGWEISIQWKYGSTTWEYLKYVKESYPVQVADYAHHRKHSDKPSFA